MRQLILSTYFFAINWKTSEHCKKRKIDIEEDASNFLDETEKDSSEDEEFPKKKARVALSDTWQKNISSGS